MQAAIHELRAAGLNTEAHELAGVLAEREAQLAAAREAKAREDEVARQEAIAPARREFESRAATYVELRDDALAALEAYVERALPGLAAYKEMQFAANRLDLLTGDSVERPETAQAIFNRSKSFKAIQHNAFSSQSL